MPIPAEVRPIVRVRTRERALDVIRAWIISGDLAPGEPVRDADLAVALGVSRTPVRVALVQFEREGLVERNGTGHLHVTRIDLDDLANIIPVRVELEALAVRLAAENGKACLTNLQRANDELERVSESIADPLDSGSITAVRSANDRFHLAILAAAGNRHLSEHLGGMRVLHQRYENLYFTNPLPVARLSVEDHAAIIDCIGDEDPDGAALAMRLHLNRAWSLVERLSGDDGRCVVAV